MSTGDFLLLQARVAGDPAIEEERQCFAREAGVPLFCIDLHDLLNGPPSAREWMRYRALFFGGSGDFYISLANLPHQEQTLSFLRAVVAEGKPLFASCYGFQALVQALGGRVVHDPPSREVGTYTIRLSPEGRRDPLLGELPESFPAQLGRKDRATVLPRGVVSLASSKRIPFQALHVPGRPIWGTQFHPELGKEDMLIRLRRYLDAYVGTDPDKRRQVLDAFRDTPDLKGTLKRFLDLVL